jgi:hypothetical protein
MFLIFNAIWAQFSFTQVPAAWKTIIELFLGPLVFLSLFLGALLRFLWKVPLIDRVVRYIFATNPNLQGTWKGTLKYEWAQERREKEVFLVIVQADAFSVQCRLFTDERESESFNANFFDENGRWKLNYQYRSSEAIERRGENPVHTGTTVLTLDDSTRPFRLKGHYYTFRNTSGELSFTKLSRKKAKSFESAIQIKAKK